MKKRKNKKLRRKIELVVKICIFVIGVCTMVNYAMNKKTDSPTPVIPDNPPSDIEVSEKVIPVPELSQEGIPTGCESVSVVALLKYWGIDIDADTFIKDYLPCQEFYYKNGELYGANPHESFAGNPYKKSSLGCYPEVIMKALSKIQSENYPNFENIDFNNISGSDFDSLTTQYLNNSVPILLWITIDLKEPSPGMQYFLEDGSLYTWTKYEHCVILCGYDDANYYFMDPLADGQIVARNKELVELRYEQMGRYALVIRRK